MQFIRKIVAFVRQTFHTDCPACHKYFFGFHSYEVQIKINNTHYRLVCHRCAAECKKLDKIG